jgi:acyl transferase domain-containing protein/acyl carrier protein/ribosomal protein S18 acetylase RimI-like enzyme
VAADGRLHAAARLNEQELVPEDIRPLIEADMDAYLREGRGGFLRPYIERSKKRWGVDNHLLADFLDSLMVVPILGLLAKWKLLDQLPASNFAGLPTGVREEVIDFLLQLQWLQGNYDGYELTPAGAFMFERAMNLGVAESYRPMLNALPALLFGDAEAVFARDAKGRETHVDRSLNVIASGFMHDRFFAEVEGMVISVFSREPVSAQPRFVADMGSGDGTFLKRVYQTVRDKTPRGRMLDRYPLTMIGIDFNEASLEETAQTLAEIDHIVVTGDIGDPVDAVRKLADLGVDCSTVLHIRSFLDHDRPYIPPADHEALQARSHARYLGAYADLRGGEIKPAEAVQSLVEHLGRWAEVVNDHGLILLEVHCQDPLVVREFLDQSESLYFDAIEGYSQQLLIEADVALMAAAEVGLFPRRDEFRKYPNILPYCRITLNRFERRPYRVRMARREDLPALERLEEACWPERMRIPAAALLRRLCDYPLGQWVLEMDDRIVGVVYSQRIREIDSLRDSRLDTVSDMHDPNGTVVQLLGLNVLPEVQHLGLGDQLLDLMLLRSSVQGGVQKVAGLTRCKNFSGASIAELRSYVAERDHNGRPVDPILQFHVSHGARIEGVVPDYRPDDSDNLGAGILICYDFRSVNLDGLNEGNVEVGDARTGDVRTRLERALRTLLGAHRQAAFSWTRTLRDIGLDSLDLLEFRTLLQSSFARSLSPTFFFAHPTLNDIHRFLENDNAAAAGAGAAPRERISLATSPQPTTVAPVVHSPLQSASPAIAVIGMAGMFPRCADIDDYWELLRDGEDGITEIPADRWDVDDYYSADPDAPGKIVSRFGGFLQDIDGFDASFFNIAPSEARLMDPQQRKLLEVHWEVLENAGIDPRTLKESACGIFVGLYSHDYELLQVAAGKENDLGAYYATGNSGSIAAGRIAYVLGTRGPALTIDTACSSSLVAVHQAMRSLRSGETDLAIASGVSLLLNPRLSIAFSKAGMLSPRGRCRTFDAGADGYVRSEACAAVVLKRLDQALRDGDPVLAVLRGSAINQDGASNGLTAPSLPAQQALLQSALRDAGLRPADIDYLEAHGTGTSLGDPVEFAAIHDVFGEDPDRKAPLWLGSAKASIGHAEAAAGVAGLIKVVLALQHRTLPAHLHFEAPNPHIDLESLPARIPLETSDWDTAGGPRRAGINSFGFSGTNAHVIVEEAPPVQVAETPPAAALFQILPLSARSHASLQALMTRYASWLESGQVPDLSRVCHAAAVGRAHFTRRRAVTGATAADFASALRTAIETAKENLPAEQPPRIAFLFTGQGSQYVDMARELATSEPSFRDALAECGRILAGELDTPLEEILYPSAAAGRGHALINDTAYTQPALFAVEYALARMLQHWGIQPSAVIGHSVGEYVAACIAGVFSLEDGLRLIAARGRLMSSLPENGAMAAVLGANDLALQLVEQADGALSVAAVNGPANIVISGAAPAVHRATGELEKNGAKVVPLQVSHAFHSALMEPIVPAFREVLRWVRFAEPRVPLASNVTGRFAGADMTTVDYWSTHLRHAVRFADGVRTLLDDGINVMLEVGPHPVLTAMGMAVAEETRNGTDGDVLWLHTLSRDRSARECLADCLAALYEKGLEPDWAAFHGARLRPGVRLPNYPWHRKSFWFEETDKFTAARERPQVLFEPRWSAQSRLDRPVTGRAATGMPDAVSVVDAVVGVRDDARAAYPDSPVGRELDAECRNVLIATLRRLGWAPARGDRVSASSLMEPLKVLPKYERLLHRMLQILAEDGLLAANGSEFELTSDLPAGGNRVADLSARYPECRSELSLLGRCVADLDQVLSGEIDALDLIFPGGDMSAAEAVYTQAPFATVGNAMVVAALEAIVAARAGGPPLRILEIGAGTGGTTASILPLLPSDTDYIFTDLSPAFLDRAQKRFRDYPFVRYELFDVEQAPSPQGFAAHQFDVVIAANVLHATADLERSVRNVSQMLSADGLMLLVEGLEPARWVDLVFGLTDGWWRFQDTGLRPDYPLLREAQWTELLGACGFKSSALAGTSGRQQAGRSPVDLLNQGVLVAQAATPQGDASAQDAPIPPAKNRWIVFADSGGVGAQFASIAARHGCRCDVIEAREKEGSADQRNARLSELLATADACGQAGAPLRIVDLRPLDLAQTTACADAMMSNATQAGMQIVELVQALSAGEHSSICLVTRHGQSVAYGEAASPVVATVWGLGNVIAAEYPRIHVQFVDLDSATTAFDAGDALYGELTSRGTDIRIAFRAGQRFVPFFSPVTPVDSEPACDAEGVYLIAGGMGEVGLQTARWLVTKGARKIVLLGRKALPDCSEWEAHRNDPILGPKIAILEELQRKGVQPQFMAVDICDGATVDALIDKIRRIGRIRGLVQAAATTSDRLIGQLTAPEYRRVLAPKVAGTWNLLQALRDEQLDFCLFYSSIGSVFGLPGQASYAAANSFLDALAHCKVQQNLTMTSINWCVWRDTGLARTPGGMKALAELERSGIASLSPNEATILIGRAIASGVRQVAAIPLKKTCTAGADGVDSLLMNLRSRYSRDLEPPASVPAKPLSHLTLANLDAPELAEKLERLVLTTIAELLDIEPATVNLDRSLGDMGMDSLLSLEFHKAIQRQFDIVLPATLAWNFPTARLLVSRIVSMVTGSNSTNRVTESVTGLPDAVPDALKHRYEVDDLTDEDALRQLMGRSTIGERN